MSGRDPFILILRPASAAVMLYEPVTVNIPTVEEDAGLSLRGFERTYKLNRASYIEHIYNTIKCSNSFNGTIHD